MRGVSFIILWILISFTLHAQNSMEMQIDSLENELAMANTDTAKVNLLCLLTRAYGGIDSIRCFDSGYNALEISRKNNYLKGIVNAYIALGGGYLDYNNLSKAKEFYITGTEHAEKLIAKDSSEQNLKLWMRGYYNLGITYGYLGDSNKEIEYAKKTIPVAESIGDTLFLAVANTNLGIKYMNFARLDEAYDSFIKSGLQYESLGNPDDIIFDRLAFSMVLHELDSFPRMKEVLDRVKVSLDKVPNHINWHWYYSQLGLYLSGTGAYNEAITSFDRSYTLLQQNKMTGQIPYLFQKYAVTYEEMGDYKMAKKYMKQFLDLSIAKGSREGELKPSYRLARYEAKLGNYKDAYYYLKNYVTILDSLGIYKTTEEIKQMELEYDMAKKEKEIIALKNENNEAALALEQRRSETYLMATITGALAFVLLLGYWLYDNKLRQARKKQRVKDAEVEKLKQEQQFSIFSAMIEGQENERKRLAIDLHDGLGGRLSGISLNLARLDKDDAAVYPKQQLQKVIRDLDDSLIELRSIARNMMPETLMKFGLQVALKDYCSSMNGNGTNITFQFYGSEKGIDTNQLVTIYRIIQELINNAIKHAKASEVLVQFIREGNNVNITVEDNGVGLDTSKLRNGSSGMGLSNLKTRVAYLDGDLDFQSHENEGTTVNIHINLQNGSQTN